VVLGSPLSSLGRLRQITAVVARHGLSHYFEGRRRRRKNKRAGAAGERADKPDASGTGGPSDAGASEIPATALRFRAMLEELGPTFIKFGQVLSTRPDLLPAGFAEALRGLQDDCPALPPQEALRAVEDGLGRPVSELFREFDATPIASASVAQVHRAVLPSGDEVAVKVRRPGIRDSVLRDLDLLRYLARLAEAIIEESGLVTPHSIVEELEAAFLSELDFEHEARNMRRFAANLAGKQRSYTVPKVYDQLSSRSVLTMEFVHGERLSSLGPDRDRKKIAANIVSASFDQLFVDGLFHADPHPGNAFILADDRIALIDFGLVGELSYAMRETLMVLVIGVATRDADMVARLLYRVGVPDERVSLYQLRDACASLLGSYLRDRSAVAHMEATRLLSDLLVLAARFHVRIPSEYTIIARAGATVEGIIRQLDPELEVLETARPYLRRLVEEQFTMPSLGEGAMKNLVRLRSFLRDLPLSATQILMDLETGKLQIQVSSREIETIARNINALGVATFAGLVASGLVTGSLFILARYELLVHGWPIIPIVGLYLASVLFGVALGWYFLAPRVHKLSLTRALSRRRRDEGG
jgi:ubiquinone biosynthesis protein